MAYYRGCKLDYRLVVWLTRYELQKLEVFDIVGGILVVATVFIWWFSNFFQIPFN